MKFYWVRHGKTLWNQQRRFQGTKDSPLTEEGRAQAIRMGQFFNAQHIQFDFAFTSPLKRAKDTARLILGEQMPIQIDTRLKEIHLGPWEGRGYDELGEEAPDLAKALWGNPLLFIDQGTESYESLQKRAYEFMVEKSKKLSKGHVLVVSHGAVIRTLYSFIEVGALKEGRVRPVPKPCTYSLISWDEKNGFQVQGYEKEVNMD